jgi:tetratricopeptide (TPR) repeat protein
MFNWIKKLRANTLLVKSHRAATREDYAHAARLATAALILQPDWPNAYAQRGICYHLNGQDDLAIQDFAQAIQLDPTNGELFQQRAEIYAEMGQHDAALRDFDTAERLLTPDADFFNLRAVSHIALDRVPDAINDLSQAIKLAPDGVAALYRRRGELYAVQGDVPAALKDYDTALGQLEPQVQQARGIVQALGDEGNDPQVQHLLGMLTREYGTLTTQRGQLRLSHGNLPGALDDFNAALEYLPDDATERARALSGRGRVRTLQNDVDALDDFQAALQLDPTRAATYFNLAEFYFQLNQFTEAHAAFQQLAQHDPENPLAEIGLALSEHALRHKNAAQQRWKRLMARDERFGDVGWLEREIFPNHPHLMKAAGNLVVRVR